MKKTITGILINPENGTAAPITLEDSLSSFYTALDCTCIDIVDRTIGRSKKRFSIVCDDEGLLKAPIRISAISPRFEPMLVGSLFVVSCDYETGELESLTEAELQYVLDHVYFTVLPNHPAPTPLLCQVDY